MSTITREQLIEHAEAQITHLRAGLEIQDDVGASEMLRLMEIAQASLEAPVTVHDEVFNRLEHEANTVTSWHHMDEHSCKVNRRDLLTLVNACRTAMLQDGTLTNEGTKHTGNSPVVQLPTEFYSENGIVVQLEKVMAALALNGIEYKRHLQAPRVSLRDAVSAIKSSGIEVGADKIQEERDALDSPVIPDGWVIVPKKITDEMGQAAFEAAGSPSDGGYIDEIWDAAIAAAPEY